MRWSLVIAACAACAACSDSGGSGTSIETVSLLPAGDGLLLGFEADGTPLVGSASSAQPIRRFDGERWAPHAYATPHQVTGFGLDLDGAPLVVSRVAANVTEVLRIEPGGTGVRIGDLVTASFDTVLQHTSGTRFLIGDQTWILRPGFAIWEPFTMPLFDPVRGPGGELYADSFSGLYRIGADDLPVRVFTCDLAPCGTSSYGIDAGGRFYFSDRETVTIFDEALGAVGTVRTPGGQPIHRFAATAHQTLVVGSPLGGDAPDAERRVFAIGSEEDRVALVGVYNPHPLDTRSVQLGVDPAGTIYLQQGNWLGRVVAATP
jgi:hypothetical protein